MTIQFMILTKMMGMSEIQKWNGTTYFTNDVNPFYKASMKLVQENFEYAKEIYKKVYVAFLNTWLENTGTFPPRELQELILSKEEAKNKEGE